MMDCYLSISARRPVRYERGKQMSMWHCEKCLGTPGFGVGCVCPRNAQTADKGPTMNDATAAGDGTLHGAIDHWQTRALEAEGKLSTSAEPSDEEIEALAHRVCTKYTHADDPSASRYEFGMLTLRQFARTLLSRYGRPAGDAQPVAIVRENPYCPEGMSDEISEYLPNGTMLYAAPVAARKPVEWDATDAGDAIRAMKSVKANGVRDV